MKKIKFILVLLALCLAPILAQEARPDLSSVLEGYIVDGKVDYEGLRKNRMAELEKFVDALATADLDSLDQTEKIAFLLDTYNGLVIYQVVTKNDAPDSKRARAKFFRGRRYKVAGKDRTLDQIEHEALRPLAKDPRVHFVLVCGADSCPILSAESFIGAADLNEKLEKATREYINNPSKVSIDPEKRVVHLNKIFDWYADDFENVLEFVARYRPEEDQKLLNSGDWKIEYTDYDWSLNQASN